MSTEIWAIGGGKGGTGKSFITSSLGIDLVRRGKKVILIDGDLGGANLHSFFGQTRPQHTLTEFFENHLSLTEIIEGTSLPNLQLAAGDIHTFNPDGIKYAQKLRFFNQIKKLDADIVLIDLGAGSGLNIIDTHLLADKMIVVAIPEITAIENLYQFLKKALFRKLNIIMRKHHFRDTALLAWKEKKGKEIGTLGELIAYFRGISPDIDRIIQLELAQFKIFLVLNQVRTRDHLLMGSSIRSVIGKHFGIEVYYSGYVTYNPLFWKYINQPEPFSQLMISTGMGNDIRTITHNLLAGQQISLTQISHD